RADGRSELSADAKEKLASRPARLERPVRVRGRGQRQLRRRRSAERPAHETLEERAHCSLGDVWRLWRAEPEGTHVDRLLVEVVDVHRLGIAARRPEVDEAPERREGLEARLLRVATDGVED